LNITNFELTWLSKREENARKNASELQMEYCYHLDKAKEEQDSISAVNHIQNLTCQ